MNENNVRSLSGGVNQSGVRDYNERLLLSLLQRNGPMPGSDLARHTNLSPQTVSVILRKLELDGLLQRGDPMRGKVGKPSIPMTLAPHGAFCIGLKIGRRSADLLLMDFAGNVRAQVRSTYKYPMPNEIFQFLETGLTEIVETLTDTDQKRICGLGIAAPSEIWNWHDLLGAPEEDFLSWKSVDFAREIAKFSSLPVSVVNDATAACQAEHIYGKGKIFRDYAYFFIGAFVGGGIVLNHSVFNGHLGNAGALGSLRTIGRDNQVRQLIDTASLHTLEAELKAAGLDSSLLWKRPQDWSSFMPQVDTWIEQTALELAKASLSACAVIDFEAILIDGAFPPEVKTKLTNRICAQISLQDARGLIVPQIEEGLIGGNARAIGAACGPILSQFFLNTNAGLVESR